MRSFLEIVRMPSRIRDSSLLAAALLCSATAIDTDAVARVRQRPSAYATHAPLHRFDTIDDAIRYAIAHERWTPQRPAPDPAMRGPDNPGAFFDVARRSRIETLVSARIGTFKAVYLPFPGDDSHSTDTLVYILRATRGMGFVRVARLPVDTRCRIDPTSSLLFCDAASSMSQRGRRWLGDRFEE